MAQKGSEWCAFHCRKTRCGIERCCYAQHWHSWQPFECARAHPYATGRPSCNPSTNCHLCSHSPTTDRWRQYDVRGEATSSALLACSSTPNRPPMPPLPCTAAASVNGQGCCYNQQHRTTRLALSPPPAATLTITSARTTPAASPLQPPAPPPPQPPPPSPTTTRCHSPLW